MRAAFDDDPTSAPYRVGEYRAPNPVIERRQRGVFVVRDRESLPTITQFLPHRLDAHAASSPDAIFLAERRDGEWVKASFLDMQRRVDALAQGLLERGYHKGDRVVIIGRNGIDHAVLMFAAMAIGLVVANLSALSLARPGGREEAACLMARVGPKAIACDTDMLAIVTALAGSRTLIALDAASLGQWSAPPTASVARAKRGLEPGDWAKLLFTSGSTGMPKGVIHTHRMLAAAQAAAAQVFLNSDVSHNVDWLPWHHTYGGNVNLNAALWRGDALWIDDGLPAPGAFEATLRNLQDIAPTFYSSVPAAFQLLVERLESDQRFARCFFSRLRGLSAGGAALSPSLVARVQRAAVAACGMRIPFGAGYGLTETCGLVTSTYWLSERPEAVGLPPPGVELKLIPLDEERYEVRVRGPNVTPGFLDDEAATAAAFDQEGWFKTGDALAWVDVNRPELGLRFAGRLAEDFKLANGTFVRAGRLRAELNEALAPLVRDVLIVGENQSEVGALLLLSEAGLKLGKAAALLQARRAIADFNAVREGATRRVARAACFESPPSMSTGEVADKGSLNVVVARRLRQREIERLFSEDYSPMAEV
ncbi:MAG: hypothetical protein DCF16_04585 [Alphaproteobacteria bacterium]|nr:MAG: hypothetical protein DCF16_04585 [Alphaproteobacteria bacterium]